MGVDPVSLGVEGAAVGEAASKGAEAAGALAPAAAASDAFVPVVAAGQTLLPEIGVTAGLPAAVGAGTEAALGGGAALGGDALAGLGLGTALGITPALADTLLPSTVVGQEFASLNAPGFIPPPGNFGTNPMTPLNINQIPGFQPGGAPLPTPRPIGSGPQAASPFSPGAPPANTTLGQPGDPTDFTTLGPGSGSATPLDITPPGELPPSGAAPPLNALTNSGVSNFFSKNAGLLSLLGLGVGGQLASPFLSKALGLDKVPGSQNLDALAAQEGKLASTETNLANTLQQPLVTGQLPAGAQASVDRALQDAISTIKGRYASLGLSGSSMEADAIANAQQQSQISKFEVAQQMAQTGQADVANATQALGLEENIYNTILNATIQQDEQLGNAISNFAAAVGMGTALGNAVNAGKTASA